MLAYYLITIVSFLIAGYFYKRHRELIQPIDEQTIQKIKQKRERDYEKRKRSNEEERLYTEEWLRKKINKYIRQGGTKSSADEPLKVRGWTDIMKEETPNVLKRITEEMSKKDVSMAWREGRNGYYIIDINV